MGISDLFSVAERAYKVSQRLRDVELNEVIVDLRLMAAGLKADMGELRAENAELRESVRALKQKADIRSKVEMRNGLYYLGEPMQGYGEGPFCTVCLDVDGILVSVHKTFTEKLDHDKVTSRRVHSGWVCGHCRNKNHK